MKRIMLLRHGKSDWSADYQTDHDRPLAPRGIKAAALMGIFLQNADLVPGRVLTSTAVRAKETLEMAMREGKWTCPVLESRALYFSPTSGILSAIQEQPDSSESILLVGHNPTWEELISELVGGGGFRMPTAALAGISFMTENWQNVEPGNGFLQFLVTPKLLKKIWLK